MSETLKNETAYDKNESSNSNESDSYEQLSSMAGQFDKNQAEQERINREKSLPGQNNEKPFDPNSLSAREAIGALYRTQHDPGDYKPEKSWDEIRKDLEPNPVTRKYKEIKYEREKRKKEKEIKNSMSLDYAVKKGKRDELKRKLNPFK